MLLRAASGLVVVLALLAWNPGRAYAQHLPSGQAAEAEQTDAQSGQTTAEEEANEVAADDEAAGYEVNTNPLEFKTDLAIWTAVIFVVLLMVLWKFAWRPIVAGLDKRERGIADDIASAEQANEDARKLLALYEEKLAQGGEEVRKLLEEAKLDAQKVGQQIVDKARQEAEAEHHRALGEIELATSGALKELAEQSATLAVELAGKIVAGRLDPASHAKLIEEAVARFPNTEPGEN